MVSDVSEWAVSVTDRCFHQSQQVAAVNYGMRFPAFHAVIVPPTVALRWPNLWQRWHGRMAWGRCGGKAISGTGRGLAGYVSDLGIF